jgi:hypothetical protein
MGVACQRDAGRSETTLKVWTFCVSGCSPRGSMTMVRGCDSALSEHRGLPGRRRYEGHWADMSAAPRLSSMPGPAKSFNSSPGALRGYVGSLQVEFDAGAGEVVQFIPMSESLEPLEPVRVFHLAAP